MHNLTFENPAGSLIEMNKTTQALQGLLNEISYDEVVAGLSMFGRTISPDGELHRQQTIASSARFLNVITISPMQSLVRNIGDD